MSYLEEVLDRLKKEGHFEEKPKTFKERLSNDANEVLETIDKYDLNFNLGTVVAHVLLYRVIGNEDNLDVAKMYLEREIERIQAE